MNLRDLNLEFKGSTKLPVSTCVKTLRTFSCLRILHLIALTFKEEGFLATHPPSCHPRRMFGCPKSERKGEKMRETGERAGRAESFSSKNFINGEDHVTMLFWGFYSQTPIQITKSYKSKHYYKEKVGRKPKREQKVKKFNK